MESIRECRVKKDEIETIRCVLGINHIFPKGDFVLRCLGNYGIHIENFKGILEYDSGHLTLSGKFRKVKISGKRIGIDYYHHDEIMILGEIKSIEYIS